MAGETVHLYVTVLGVEFVASFNADELRTHQAAFALMHLQDDSRWSQWVRDWSRAPSEQGA